MSSGIDPIQRAVRVDGALSARAVLEFFERHGRAQLGAPQADAAGRIAGLLAHEAALAAAWSGLPGTEHPRHWQPAAGDEAALADAPSANRRLDVHLPLWWTLPLLVRDRGPQRIEFPLAATREGLAALVRRHMPGGWWDSTVRVTLDVETRIYWGARGAVPPQSAGREACALRGETGHASMALLRLDSGHAVETALPARQSDPSATLRLHPGVGWLVALPVLRFEREASPGERLKARVGRWWDATLRRDSALARDPTFAGRLAAEEAWWAARLRAVPADAGALAAAARRGAALRPASLAALQPPARREAAQVILLHGGLSCVRGAFAAALEAAPANMPPRGADVPEAGPSAHGEAHPPSRDADAPVRPRGHNADAPVRPRGHDASAPRGAGPGAAAPALDTVAAWDTLAARRAGTAPAAPRELEGAPSASRALSPALRDAATRAAAAALIAAAECRAPATGELPPALWPGLPELDARPAWRFEHDTFVGIARNVARLVEAVRRECVDAAAPPASRHVVLVAHARGGNVARFALPALRKAFAGRGWTFAAVTLGSPHLGTHAYARMGARWHGLAAAAGGLRRLDAPGLDKARLAELVQLERGLADALPQGFRDLEPAGVLRLARGRPATALPPGMWLVGSRWGPGAGPTGRAWDWLFEDAMGADEEGDGLVQRHSALGGRTGADAAACFDASPVFHTHYLAHEPTRAQVARMLAQALAAGRTGSAP